MKPLAARWAHGCVVVQRPDECGATLSRQRCQRERQVQQTVHVHHVRLHGVENLRQPFTDDG